MVRIRITFIFSRSGIFGGPANCFGCSTFTVFLSDRMANAHTAMTLVDVAEPGERACRTMPLLLVLAPGTMTTGVITTVLTSFFTNATRVL